MSSQTPLAQCHSGAASKPTWSISFSMFKWDALTKGPSASRPSTHTHKPRLKKKEKRAKEEKGGWEKMKRGRGKWRKWGGDDEGQYWTWDRNPFSVFCARLAIVWLCGSQRPLAANSRLGWKFNEGFNHYERPGILLRSLSLSFTHTYTKPPAGSMRHTYTFIVYEHWHQEGCEQGARDTKWVRKR